MFVKEHLPPGCAYFPVDCCKRDECTTVVDLNVDPVPALADTALALGLLEYIFDPGRLLTQMAKAYQRVIVSYNPVELEREKEASAAPAKWELSGAVPRYTVAQFEQLLTVAGFSIVKRTLFGERQYIYDLTA